MEISQILDNYRLDNKSVSKDNLIKLYEAAKDAYYNGAAIMEDFEFDELEKVLGLENKSYVGTKHNPKYTINHPFSMGSLSKIQIHKNKDGEIEWDKYYSELTNYITYPNTFLIITPKFDGCSFEAVIDNKTIVSISSRGDGTWGKDYKKHLEHHIANVIANIHIIGKYVLRGEVLINKNVFVEKYSEFVNPRSFVSGIINRDFDDATAEICKDLSIIIYDVHTNDNDTWVDKDWTIFSKDVNNSYGYIDDKYLPKYYFNNTFISNADELKNVYNNYEIYRNEKCEFALDGIVIKPISSARINNLTEYRPTDCVAIKFIPMLEETEVEDIIWNLGKSEEYTPIIITKPVIMDGKSVSRAKANNIGYLLKNKISIGTKVVLSLAGDIIPFIYKITNTDNFSESKINVPENTKVDGIHLMAVLSEEERSKQQLRNSMLTLNIPGIGGQNANDVVDYMVRECAGDEFFDIPAKPFPNNIFLVTPTQLELALGGKTGSNARKAYEKILKDIDLKTIICSCNFHLCGGKVASQIVNYLLGESYDFASMAREGYGWCMINDSDEMQLLNSILSFIGYSIEDFKKKNDEYKNSTEYRNAADQIPVILTGEPNNYKSKGDFLNNHPEYRMTGSWKEVKIVFTNSLDSNTGKMKQARAKGIEIKLY